MEGDISNYLPTIMLYEDSYMYMYIYVYVYVYVYIYV